MLKREWFSTYKPYDGGSVLIGNYVMCKIVGIGNIRMRMFDGQVRTLTNVRHVPDLRSLLSLGLLEPQGCKFQVTKGSMTILKENGPQLVQDERKHYYW